MGQLATRVENAMQRFARRAVLARLTNRTWRGQAMAVLATLGLMVFMVRVLGAGWPKQFAIFFPDSFSFKKAASHTPLSFQFYADERPIAYPTLLFLLGRSTVVTVVVQTFLYGLAYIGVAYASWKILRRREAAIVCAFLLVTIGLEPRFALWNSHILSESFGMTLAVVSVTAWWWFSAGPSVRRLNIAGAATLGWLTVRDSNVPNWLAVGVPAALIASFWWRSASPSLRRGLRVWGVVMLAVGIGVALTQSANGRNRYATMNNVGTRVLPNDEITDWFEDQGMPVDAALRARTGRNSFDNNWDMLISEDLAEFREWADGPGQRIMLLSYARFLPIWLDKLSDDLPTLLSSTLSGYDAFQVADRLPDPAPAQINGPTTRNGLFMWTCISVVGLCLAALRKRQVQAIVLGALLLSTFVDLYMAYIGDSVEVQRHMVGPLSRMSLIMVICFGVGLDSLIELVVARTRRAPAGQTAAEGQVEGEGEAAPVDAPVEALASAGGGT